MENTGADVYLNGDRIIYFDTKEQAEAWVKNYNDNARYKRNFIVVPKVDKSAGES
jgi:hypothetical protein